MRAFVFSLFIGIGALIATSGISAQRADGHGGKLAAAVRAANNRFAGVWKLVGEETRDAKGQIVPPGPNANSGGRFGYIVYDPAGYMGVTIAWLKRPTFAGPQPTPQEALAAMSTYNSYWGSFAVNEARSVVTHQTFGALSPATSGTNQERGFTISGNRLTLRPPTSANGDQRTSDLGTRARSAEPDADASEVDRLLETDLVRAPQLRKANCCRRTPPWTGFIVYTASGHVMVHMMQPYRRRNVGPSPTPEETMATYRSYTSYFGPYTVNESENSVVHHLAASINSGQVGTDFQRFFEFSGKRLILKPPVTKDSNGQDVQTTITWERLSD